MSDYLVEGPFVGDVISLGTGKVVQFGSLSEPPRVDSDLVLDPVEVQHFRVLVDELYFACSRADQVRNMALIRRVVLGWPDG